LQRLTSTGRWRLHRRAALSPSTGNRSRYSFVLPRRRRIATYRVVVVPNDGGAHVSGSSRAVTVLGKRRR
jgi:hypothetical protein